MADRFVHQHLRGTGCAPGYVRDASSILRRFVIRRWRGRDVATLKRVEIKEMLQEVKGGRRRGAGGPVQANRVKRVLGKMLNWTMNNEGLIDANPCTGMDRPTQEKARHRALSDQELAAVWLGAERSLAYPWTQLVKLQALTGQREGDATAILDYFAPLKKWLDEQNTKNNAPMGW